MCPSGYKFLNLCAAHSIFPPQNAERPFVFLPTEQRFLAAQTLQIVGHIEPCRTQEQTAEWLRIGWQTAYWHKCYGSGVSGFRHVPEQSLSMHSRTHLQG